MKKRILCLLLALGLLASLCACKGKTDSKNPLSTKPADGTGDDTEGVADIPFDMPETYECVLQLVMDPIVELYLDGDENIIAIRYLNEEALAAFESVEENVCVALSDGIKVLANTAITGGYLNDTSTVIMQVTNDEDGLYDGVLTRAETAIREVITERTVNCSLMVLRVGQEDLDVSEDDVSGVDENPDVVTPNVDVGGNEGDTEGEAEG